MGTPTLKVDLSHGFGRLLYVTLPKSSCARCTRPVDLSAATQAIRQALDIGLDSINEAHWPPHLLCDRTRVWLSCLIADRW
jgi:hypothetical protein